MPGSRGVAAATRARGRARPRSGPLGTSSAAVNVAPEERRDAERREQCWRSPPPAATRSGSPSPVRLTCPSPHAATSASVCRAPAIVDDFAGRHPGLVERGPPAPDHHRAIRLGPRQRPQQHGVHDAEDRGVGADAERQRQHGDGGKAGVARERARAEAQVLARRSRASEGGRMSRLRRTRVPEERLLCGCLR